MDKQTKQKLKAVAFGALAWLPITLFVAILIEFFPTQGQGREIRDGVGGLISFILSFLVIKSYWPKAADN